MMQYSLWRACLAVAKLGSRLKFEADGQFPHSGPEAVESQSGGSSHDAILFVEGLPSCR